MQSNSAANGVAPRRAALCTILIGLCISKCTQPLAGTGCPVLTVPIARPAQLPIGVQLLARPGREDLLLQVARYLEQAGVAAAPVTLRKARAVGG